jgi:hypothetical protein
MTHFLVAKSQTSFTRSHLVPLQLQCLNESTCEFLLGPPPPIVSGLHSRMSLSLLKLSLLLLETL